MKRPDTVLAIAVIARTWDSGLSNWFDGSRLDQPFGM
jgi:hypothetical protein